ncbi:hypothetical protein F5Y07DRAFT_400116 [Xylaria sp. FL0933]|nr:hypothetical protein F5Y07DRAFT_400116 [Xylaria sp. FL0933]
MDNKKITQTALNNDNVETRCPPGPPEQSSFSVFQIKDTQHKDGTECGHEDGNNYDALLSKWEELEMAPGDDEFESADEGGEDDHDENKEVYEFAAWCQEKFDQKFKWKSGNKSGDEPLERPRSPRIARKERERPRDRNPHPTDYATYNYTLKDGTIVKGKRGVTFAGFIAPSQVPKGTPEASRMRERRDPANPRFMMPELPLKTRLSIAQGQSAVERAARDTAVQPADRLWDRKRESAPSPPGDAPRRKKIKWGHIEILDYND